MSEELPAIPARSLPLSARAPGKCIVFGEHAVVHGAPELVFAVDLTTQVFVTAGESSRLNSDAEAAQRNAYFRSALELAWKGRPPIEVRAVSRIPRSAGLGSSAAFVAALAAALASATGGVDRAALAQRSFEIERGAQGVGSPGDTSTVVAGGFVAINGGPGDPLWSVRSPEHRWEVRRVSDPGWVWVIAFSGIPRSTADAVRAVGARLAAPGGPELLEEFRRVATEGIEAVGRGDRRTGRRALPPEPGTAPGGRGLPSAPRGASRSRGPGGRRGQAHRRGCRRLGGRASDPRQGNGAGPTARPRRGIAVRGATDPRRGVPGRGLNFRR